MENLDNRLIEKYLEGTCSNAEAEQILAWLNASEENRKEWLKLRVVTAKSAFERFSDTGHVDRSYNEIRKERAIRIQLERDITRKVTLRLMRYAASILLFIGISFVAYKYVADWRHPEMIVVAVGGNEPVRQVILNDSTRVWLSPNSRIEYPGKFNEKEREISVEGKVYFEVFKDTSHPFFVKTDNYIVKVLGTSFEVNSFKSKLKSDVVLVEGLVEVLGNDMTTLCRLNPGNQFELDKTTGQFRLTKVEAEMYTAWHGGKLEFDGMTFAEIAKVLERHYNVRIVLNGDVSKMQRLVGSLSFEKDINEMMKTIGLVVPIQYRVEVDTVVYIENQQ